jgi:hypothetical protein
MITLTGPKAAVDEGSCSACNNQEGPKGIKTGSWVFILSLIKSANAGASFRLCPECLIDLTELLQATPGPS